MNVKVFSFTDLIVWQKGHKLVLDTYKVTKTFPNEELFILTAQLRRCAISITSNIAEGFSRKGKKEKIQFYFTSLGSLTELHNQLIIAKDLHYITENEFSSLLALMEEVHKMLVALMKSAENRK